MGSGPAASSTSDRVAPAEVVEAELNEIAGGLNVLHGRFVDVAVQCLAEPGVWRGVGIRSLEHWLCWRMGLTSAMAKQITTVARRADELPTSVSRLREGRLSLGQVVEIARWAPWWVDEQVADLTEHMTVSQTRRLLKRTHFDDFPRPDAGADTPEPPGDREHCQFGYDDKGRFFLHLLTDEVTGGIIESALAEARDALFQNGRSGTTWVHALEEVAQRSLDTVDSPSRRDRFKLHYHLDLHGGAVDPANTPVPDSIARYLTCDGGWDPIFTANAIPVSIGRNDRIVPDRTRRVVLLRDGGCCRVPGCRQQRWLEIHHIVHWRDGGVTDTSNLVALCPHHHRLHHRGDLGIVGNADQPGRLRFTHADGSRITGTGADPVTKLRPQHVCPPLRTWNPGTAERFDMHLVTWRPPWRNPRWRHHYPPDTDDHSAKRRPATAVTKL